MILPSKNDIDNISYDILKSSKSLDIFPTPIEKIVQHSELYIAGGIDLKSLEKKYKSSHFSEALKSGLSKIRGFLDRREKVIYLDMDQIGSRQNFVTLHETGHNVLPWQNKTLEFLDDDETLDPDTQEEFEMEANYFASVTLFQNDRFDNHAKRFELGMPSVVQLSNHFGASVHATFRRYVENTKYRCALLILKNLSEKGKVANGDFRNSFHSESFLSNFGSLEWPENFGYKWEFIKDHLFLKKKWKVNGSINLKTLNGNVDFTYHYFGNSYNSFVLIFPKGENKATKTKIVLK
ncbi:ImmA/IrrE family metallo-endopeptidase [Flavobacterium sp. IMCC34852]|uniref:ImmA/IrrE family metallo-endopeptidase n=1 Tax=Flavobacterium rivulicola TaxID=2732161 RepID=A0A7Y3R8P1_9FLAO|nr:ImmA/IrrE family metallo-endopeptidase [Flavobacterium sp. IMCC34852]NNT71575.1 ImmA/IrrE family metallo-endopeptidase [Flavobacterium sp. IMCC34852]